MLTLTDVTPTQHLRFAKVGVAFTHAPLLPPNRHLRSPPASVLQNCSKTYAAATTGINVNYLPKTNWGQFVKVGNADGSYTYH